MMTWLSTLSLQEILAVQSNFLWVNLLTVAVIAAVAVACLAALKKT